MTTSRVISSGTKRRITSSAWVTGWVARTFSSGQLSDSGPSAAMSSPPADGVSRTNKYSEVGFDLLRAQILSGVIVQGMKYSFQRERPSGACCAFPSGHSAAAFAAAAVLERHLGYRLSWPALVGATYVATSRLVDNRHFLSDVVFGAAVGTASGWTVVGTRGRKHPIVIQPVPVKGGMMIAVMRMPRSSRAHGARCVSSPSGLCGPDAGRWPDRAAL